METGIQCVVLAGGLAERMRPLTERIPKSLLPVGPHPFVHYQLQWLASQGVTEVVLCVGYLGEQIRDYVGDGARWNLSVRYVDEGPELRGTGGALRLAAERGALQERFLLTYGDSFLPVDFRAVWKSFTERNVDALMTVYRNQGRWDSSNACFSNGCVTLYDKSRQARQNTPFEFIDYGLSALKREVILSQVPSATKYDLATLFHQLSVDGRLAGYEITTRFYEIGSREGLTDFTQYVLSGQLDSKHQSP